MRPTKKSEIEGQGTEISAGVGTEMSADTEIFQKTAEIDTETNISAEIGSHDSMVRKAFGTTYQSRWHRLSLSCH